MAQFFGNTMLAGDYTVANMGPSYSLGSSSAGASSGAAAGGSNAFATAAPYMMALGAVQSMVGTYYAAQNQKYQLAMQGQQQEFSIQSQGLNATFQYGMNAIQAESAASTFEFNAAMADINARQMENQAQWSLLTGQRQIGQVTMRAGKIKSAQKASQAARGISLGYGSTAEEIATTDLMKEMDAITIETNSVRAANAARTQKVGYENQALLSRTSASSARAAGKYYTGAAATAGAYYSAAASNIGNYYSTASDAVNPWMMATASLGSSASSYANRTRLRSTNSRAGQRPNRNLSGA